MKLLPLLLILLLFGCVTPLTEAELEEREYEYQEYLDWWRHAVANCDGYLLLDNHIHRYPRGIENHPRPDMYDMKHTYCVPRSGGFKF